MVRTLDELNKVLLRAINWLQWNNGTLFEVHNLTNFTRHQIIFLLRILITIIVLGNLCELKGITDDNDEKFEEDMYQKYGPLNVAFDFYPTNTTLELTLNNITRFVVVNENHKKRNESSPVLKLSPTAAREFLITFTGLVPCEFHIPPTPRYYTYKFWLYTGFISTMVLTPIVLALIF